MVSTKASRVLMLFLQEGMVILSQFAVNYITATRGDNWR